VPDQRPLLDRRRFIVAGLGAVLAACAGQTDGDPVAAGDAASDATSPSPSDTPSPEASTPASPAPSPSESFDITTTPGSGEGLPTGIVPTRTRIPSIGVDAPCIELNLGAEEVEVPEDFDDTGWWIQTRKPGEIGPAVIGGHVDSRSGPAVFFRLDELRPGDEVVVEDDQGETRTFVVSEDPIQVDKHDRPPEVFGFTNARPELRLITCGGDFNPNIGHYVDNIVVFCHDPSFEAA
jgi:sortase (surface protein transpeptidase)